MKNELKKVKKNVRKFVIVVGLMLCIINAQNKNFADAKELLKSEVTDMYEKVLSAVQPMNIDNLKVGIKDSVNVVDTEGELCGYSFGYEVDNKPYGYAIYDINNQSVKEFVFCEGVSNMYKELEEKAEDNPNVDEDELLNGIVYEGGIDYCTYDNEGEKIELNDKVNDTGNDLYLGNDYDDVVFDNIVDSDYMITTSNYGNYGHIMCDQDGYWSVHDSNTSWCVVPDCGLAMVSSKYIGNYEKDYACADVAATGVINWMGRENGSIIGTYNNLYNYLDYQGKIDHQPAKDENGNIIYKDGKIVYSGHGITLGDLKDALKNHYFPSVNCGTSAFLWSKKNESKKLSFDYFEKHIGTVGNGELSPCILGIWINYKYCNNIINGKYNGDFAHAVTVLSTLRNSNDDYIGIWNGWDFSDKDFNVKEITEEGLLNNVDTLSSAYRAIRYISWSDLNKNNVSIDAIFFENVQSANIKEVHVNYLSPKTIELSCYVPSGTKHVYFPTWDANGDQSDVIWHEGTIDTTRNAATVKINLTQYNNNATSVTYATDIYARDKNGKDLAVYRRSYNTVYRSFRNVNVSDVTEDGYTVNCTVPTGTASVYFPTWTSSNGQDDIVWHKGELIGETGRIRIKTSDHNPESGEYITHIYAYDKYGVTIMSTGVKTIVGRISSVSVTNKTIHGYRVTCTVPKGTTSVKFPTWSAKTNSSGNAQDDIIWHVGTINNGKATIDIDTSDHYNDGGLYYTHIYVYDKYGCIITSYGTSTSIYNRNAVTSEVYNKTSSGYSLHTYLPTGTVRVRYYIAAIEAGRYGVRDYTYNVNNTTGNYYKTVNTTDFMNAKGIYSNDIYAYDFKGYLISTVHVSVDVK